MQQTSEALRAWFRRVEPMCPELFNAAYAMCGNYELAEQALCATVVELWAQDVTPGMGFRERTRAILREEAFAIMDTAQARDMELTWPGLPEPRSNDPILRQAAQEKPENQRILLLRHGCGLSARAIGELVDETVEHVRSVSERFETRCRRKLPSQSRGRADAMIVQRFQQLLTRGGPDTPSAARIYRAFEAEASRSQVVSHRLPRILSRALLLLTALLCALAFWLFAVLAQPAAPASIPAPAAQSQSN